MSLVHTGMNTLIQRCATAGFLLILTALLVLPGAIPAVAGDAETDCYSDDNLRRLSGCSELIERGTLSGQELSLVYNLRALAYSIKEEYEQAIADYDKALVLDAQSPSALNNRAWAYYKSGRPKSGEADVARSLELEPHSPQALDTRAHIHQSLGRPTEALADYNQAMYVGGARIVKLYQCGLQSHGLYAGAVDGQMSQTLKKSLESCVFSSTCDPLPADEECRKIVS